MASNLGERARVAMLDGEVSTREKLEMGEARHGLAPSNLDAGKDAARFVKNRAREAGQERPRFAELDCLRAAGELHDSADRYPSACRILRPQLRGQLGVDDRVGGNGTNGRPRPGVAYAFSKRTGSADRGIVSAASSRCRL